MEINITIPDTEKTRVVDSFAKVFGYREVVDDPDNIGMTMANPSSKEDFVKVMMVQFVKDTVAKSEIDVAMEVAKNNVLTSSSSIDIQ